MLRTARMLCFLALGLMTGLASAEATSVDTAALPCNALCRRWMGLGEATAPEPSPVAAERQTATAPIVAAPLPPPVRVVPRRPEPTAGLRQSPAVAAVQRPPIKPRREPRAVEARRPTLPLSAGIGATRGPVAVPPPPADPPARLAGAAPTVAVATAQPAAIAVHKPEPALGARTVDVVLPALEQPPPPMIVAPSSARADAFPPAFDVIATLLLTAPPRR